MRIVGGRFRGRTLRAPKGPETRPTADRTRQALFDVLIHGLDVDLNGASVLDLFAGTGALGLEAMSRGAARAAFVENDADALRTVRRNAAELGVVHDVALLRLDAVRLPPPPRSAPVPAAVAFLDPPYGSGLIGAALTGALRHGWLAPGAVCVAELAEREPLSPLSGFPVLDERSWGAARVVFLRAPQAGSCPQARS